MMPGEDGLSVCRHLRSTTDLPVILLTAMAEETDRIVGLEVGADDYVSKPFNPRELLAVSRRCFDESKACRRKRAGSRPRSCASIGGPSRSAGASWWKRRRRVPLSTAEFRLLCAFLDHPGLVLSRNQLLDLTVGRDADPFDRSIDNQVSRLRKKIEADPKVPALIKTHWGGGYSLAAQVEQP